MSSLVTMVIVGLGFWANLFSGQMSGSSSSSQDINTVQTAAKSTEVEKSKSTLVGDKKFHKPFLGFHLTYIGQFDSDSKAIDRLAADGVENVIFYEPWYKGWDNKRILAFLKKLTDKGMKVEVSLSNFPYEKGTFKEKLEKIKKHKGVINKNKFKKIYKYTNRFTPKNYKAYTDTLRHLLNEIKSQKMNDKIKFEIGSEPNTYKYFWGSSDDFLKFAKTVYPILKEYGYEPVCCGFSTGIFMHPNPKAKKMKKTVIPWAQSKNIPISNSLYMWTSKSGKAELNKFPTKIMEGGQFSAYGHFSSYEKGKFKHNFKYSGAHIKNLVKLLKKMYSDKMTGAYMWHLQDIKNKPTVDGYFDKDGKPHKNYEYFIMIYNLIKDGYYILESTEKVHVVGKSQTLILAKKDIGLSSVKLEKATHKYNVSAKGLKKDDWIIYSH